jgi:hypothetical protein
MQMSHWKLSRRTMLRGLGTAVALPVLDCMGPVASVFAAPAQIAAGKAGATPLRLAFCYVPNGIHMQEWTPSEAGENFELTPTLKVLEQFKSDMVVLSGLAHDKAEANGDGPGDHARAMATFLTGCQAKKTGGADIKVGISVDQLAAQKVGDATRFASLELSCDKGRQSGECDSGYSCAYSSNISWKTPSSPVTPETNPRLVFERLFSGGSDIATAAARAERTKYQKSILDYVRQDAARLQDRLGANDKRKLDEYLTSVREIEARLSRIEEGNRAELGHVEKPTGVPKEYNEYLRLMADMLVLAFQTDTTRIGTFIFANEGSNRSYAFMDVSEGHHDLSHHGRNKEKQAKIAKINRFHLEQFAYFIGKLKSTKEGDGTLLDNSMVVYGSCIGDGNRHNHNDLPVVVLGKGGGTIKTGRHMLFDKKEEIPLANLWMSLLDRMGAKNIESLGDATGKLDGLMG